MSREQRRLVLVIGLLTDRVQPIDELFVDLS